MIKDTDIKLKIIPTKVEIITMIVKEKDLCILLILFIKN